MLSDVLTFYFLLCYRPFGIQFHVETSLFNVYFAKLDRGDGQARPLGRRRRTSRPGEMLRGEETSKTSPGSTCWTSTLAPTADVAPITVLLTLSGAPLSPRFLTIKARDYAFQHYPCSARAGNGIP